MTAFSYFDYGRHLWISNEANNQHGLDDKRWDPLRDIVQSSLSYGYNRFAQETPADQTIERSVGSRRSFRLIMADIAYTIIVGNQGEFVVYWYQFFSITLRFLLIGKLSVLYIVSSCCHFTRYFIWLCHRALRALSLPNDVHEPTKRLYYQLCITICHVLDF